MLASTQASGSAALKRRDQMKASLVPCMSVNPRNGKTEMKMVPAPPTAGEMLGETVRQRQLLGRAVCRIRNLRFWRVWKPWRDGAEVVRQVRKERAIAQAKQMALARQRDGMEKLVMTLTAIMQGEMGVALLCFRLNMDDHKKAAEHRRLKEAEHAEQLRLAMEKREEELKGGAHAVTAHATAHHERRTRAGLHRAQEEV